MPRPSRAVLIAVGYAAIAQVILLLIIGGVIWLGQRGTLKVKKASTEATIEKVREHGTANPHGNFGRILRNNALATTLLLLVGVGTGGLYVVLYLAQFGVAIGLLVVTLLASGMPVELVVAFLVPHGIIELPAFCLAAGVGLRAGVIFLRYLRKGGELARPEELKQLGWTALAAFVGIVLAALVEAYITPRIALGYLP